MVTETSRHFGTRLRLLRNERGKPQSEIVNEINQLFPAMRISQTSLSVLEQSEKAPREDVLTYLCQYYRVPISYFFAISDHMTPEKYELISDYIEALRLFIPSDPRRYIYRQWKQRIVRKPLADEEWL